MVKIHFLAYFAFCFVVTCLPSVAMNNFLGGLIVFVFLWAIGIFYIIRYESIKNKKPSFITIVAENFAKAFSISIAWSFKAIFKGLKWLFKPEHIRLFFFLIKEGIFLFLGIVFTVFVFVFMFTFSV